MKKIFTSSQIRDLDQFTIEHEPIASIDLMERASRAFVDWFAESFSPLKKVGIVCGSGNNGGDGLAIARQLKEWGYPVKVWIIDGKRTNDFSVNLVRLRTGNVELTEIAEPPPTEVFSDRDILIDAIFGTGLSRPADGIYAAVIKTINQTGAIVVSVDMPSGLMADKPASGPVVEAAFTITFQSPRLSFFFPENHRFTGEWKVVDIGLREDGISIQDTPHFMISRKGVRRLLKSRGRFDHKGTYGHALFVGGSYGKMGAAVLASRAALRSGCGLLTVYSPRCGYTILQTAVPEAMVITGPEEDSITEVPDLTRYQAIGVGPGLGQSAATQKMLRSLLEKASVPIVLDADALNIIGMNREMLHLIPPNSILTPHPKEFERLAGSWKDSFARLDMQRDLARQLNSVVVVKGAFTCIATPAGTVYFNSTGNPGMATGGTGDVLAGIITGLMAQGYTAENASLLGVYLHGLAADIGVPETGQESFVASDLISFLPVAFRKLKR